jgi:nondiscriminating aspartyl-tRNA synthetase
LPDSVASSIRRNLQTDLFDDLDPEAERELCRLAEAEHGVAAVFVIGFPLSARPFYTHPRTAASREGAAAGFDLLFNGLEITTGGQRLHRRADLEAALCARGLSPASFLPPSASRDVVGAKPNKLAAFS